MTAILLLRSYTQEKIFLKKCLYKNFCVDVHSNMINNSQKLKETNAYHWWMNKQKRTYPRNDYYPAVKTEQSTDACWNVG